MLLKNTYLNLINSSLSDFLPYQIWSEAHINHVLGDRGKVRILLTPIQCIQKNCTNVFTHGEGKRPKEFAEWYVEWRAEFIRNTIYAGNKLTEERILFSRQFYKRSSFFDVADY